VREFGALRSRPSTLGNADLRAKLLAQGAEPAGGTSEALGKVVAVELPKWAGLAREMRIKGD